MYVYFQTLVQKRQQVLAEYEELQQKCHIFFEIMKDEAAFKEMDGQRDSKSIISYLNNNFNVSNY